MYQKQKGFAPAIILLIGFLLTTGGVIAYRSFLPFKVNFSVQMNNKVNAPSANPAASSASAIPTPSVQPTQEPAKVVIPESVKPLATVVPTSSCVKVKTYGAFTNDSEFEAEKCYTSEDANKLDDAIRKYNNASFNYKAAASRANVTCQGFTESFKQQCEQSKKDADKYKAEVDKYKAEIRDIINRAK